MEVARRAKDAQVLSHAVAASAIVALAQDRRVQAGELASELPVLGEALVFAMTFGWPTLADVAWLMHDLDQRPDLLRILDEIPVATPWADAARAIAVGEFARSADILGEMGHAVAEADARLRAGEALLQVGHRADADAHLARALEFYRRVGATTYIEKGEALLAASA